MGGAEAGAEGNTPPELVSAIGDAEAGAEGNTPPTLVSIEAFAASLVASAAGGSLKSRGGSPGVNDLAGTEPDAPPNLRPGSSDL